MGQVVTGNGAVPDQRTDERVARMLDTVRRQTLELLAGLPQRPSRLRVRAGGVSIEAEWAAPVVAEAAATAPPTRTAAPVADHAAGDPPAASGSAEAGADERRYVCAPTVGVFYRAPEPGARPFVREGDRVAPGQQVGIVEAMKLMIPVTCPHGGVVTAVLKTDGEAVEYDEPLIALTDASGTADRTDAQARF